MNAMVFLPPYGRALMQPLVTTLLCLMMSLVSRLIQCISVGKLGGGGDSGTGSASEE